MALTHSLPLIKAKKELPFLSLTILCAAVALVFFSYTGAAVFYALGQRENRIEYLKTAVRLNPRADSYRRTLSQSYLAEAIRLGDEGLDRERAAAIESLIRQALIETKAAVILNQSNPENFLNAASIYSRLIGTVTGAADKAEELLHQAAAADARNPQPHFKLAELYHLTGRDDEARAEYGVIIKKFSLIDWDAVIRAREELGK